MVVALCWNEESRLRVTIPYVLNFTRKHFFITVKPNNNISVCVRLMQNYNIATLCLFIVCLYRAIQLLNVVPYNIILIYNCMFYKEHEVLHTEWRGVVYR